MGEDRAGTPLYNPHRGAGWDLNSDIFPEENIRWGNFKEPSGVGLYPISFTVWVIFFLQLLIQGAKR